MFLGFFTSCEDDCPDCTCLEATLQTSWDLLYGEMDMCAATDLEVEIYEAACEELGGSWE